MPCDDTLKCTGIARSVERDKSSIPNAVAKFISIKYIF